MAIATPDTISTSISMAQDLFLPITLTMAAAATLINFWLALRIGRVRTSQKIFMGDGGNDMLYRRMRAQSNHIENAPFFVLMIGAVEISGFAGTWAWVLGMVFMIGRIAHGLGMDGGALKIGRMIGTIITMVSNLGLALACIYWASIG